MHTDCKGGDSRVKVSPSRPVVLERDLPILLICISVLFSVFLQIAPANDEIPIEGAVYSVHRSDGSLMTYLEIVVKHTFEGKLPDHIDSISVSGPSGFLDISKADFNYNAQWRSYWTALPGLPEPGRYDFQVKSGTLSGSDSEIQVVSRVIPLPDERQFRPTLYEHNICSSPTFNWPLVSAEVPLYYQFELNEGPLNIFRTGYVQDMSSVRIAGEKLQRGGIYRWRVRVADGPEWSVINNRSQSGWIRFRPSLKTDSCNYQYSLPLQTDDGLRVSSLQSEGVDEAIIKTLMIKILNEEIPNIQSLLIVKNNKLVLDEYFGGYALNALHPLASVSKSITSILIGIAIDQLKIPSVNSLIYDLLPSYHDRNWDTSHKSIQLKHVLTMTAGLEWNDWIFPDGDMRDSTTAMSKSEDWIEYTLDRKTVERPGEKFVYNNGLSLILGEIIKDSTSYDADKYAEKHLFTPLNIKDYRWRKAKNSIIETAGGLELRPRDMAKIGSLMLNGGTWQGRHIVSSNWVNESTRMQLREQILLAAGYGYQWWRGEMFSGKERIDLYYAAGKGGQYIFVCPKLDLITIVTSEVNDNQMGEFRPQMIMTDYVIPAVLPELVSPPQAKFSSVNKEKFAGKYYSSTYGVKVELINQANKLFYIDPDDQKGEIHFISDNQCIAESEELGNIRATFSLNKAGEATHFMLQVGFGFWRFDKTD